MHRIVLRGVGIFTLAVVITLLAGCAGPIFRVKVFNEGDFPLTSVRLVPYLVNEAAQERAFDDAVNLLPKDGDGATIALGVGQTQLLPHLLRGDLYYVVLSFYIDNQYYERVLDTLIDLRDIEKNALITLSVRCEFPSNAAEPIIMIFVD